MSSAKIIKIDPLNPQEEHLQEAADILKSGGLVIIPTETVYGIAANAFNKETISRLDRIKNRPKDKPYTLLIDKKERMEESARNIPVSAYKLTDKFWPGPLTLILRSKTEGKIGLRMPDNLVALKVIALAGVPVVCPSANISGEAAPTNCAQALKDLSDKIDLALDAGPSKIAEESTVVDLTEEKPKIIRQGAIKQEEVEAAINKKIILFICTGNSCRSVMASALLEKKLKEANRADVQVLSAGIMHAEGMGATEATKEVLREEGIDISHHLAKRVNKQLIKKSDLILVMEKSHEQRIVEMAPEVRNRVFLLKEFAKINDNRLDIEDPIGKSQEFYEKTFTIIKDAIERVAKLI